MREDVVTERNEGHPGPQGGRAQEVQSRRKFALAVLDQLHQDFAAMGKSRQAKPLLHELMALAKTPRPRAFL